MSLVAVVGECASTTAVALAAGWPAGERVVLAELDPAGGVMSAWLDVPRSPGLSELVASNAAGSWPVIESMVQCCPSGLEVLVGPSRAVEAAATVGAAGLMLPVVSALGSVVVIADGGRLRGTLSALTVQAGLVVVVHRQHPGSAAAATAGLERVGELCSLLSVRSIPFVVALVGDEPYGGDEVAAFVGADLLVELAVDPWAAAVLAGRAASPARLKRSALAKSAAGLAATVSVRLRELRSEFTWQDVAISGETS